MNNNTDAPAPVAIGTKRPSSRALNDLIMPAARVGGSAMVSNYANQPVFTSGGGGGGKGPAAEVLVMIRHAPTKVGEGPKASAIKVQAVLAAPACYSDVHSVPESATLSSDRRVWVVPTERKDAGAKQGITTVSEYLHAGDDMSFTLFAPKNLPTFPCAGLASNELPPPGSLCKMRVQRLTLAENRRTYANEDGTERVKSFHSRDFVVPMPQANGDANFTFVAPHVDMAPHEQHNIVYASLLQPARSAPPPLIVLRNYRFRTGQTFDDMGGYGDALKKCVDDEPEAFDLSVLKERWRHYTLSSLGNMPEDVARARQALVPTIVHYSRMQVQLAERSSFVYDPAKQPSAVEALHDDGDGAAAPAAAAAAAATPAAAAAAGGAAAPAATDNRPKVPQAVLRCAQMATTLVLNEQAKTYLAKPVVSCNVSLNKAHLEACTGVYEYSQQLDALHTLTRHLVFAVESFPGSMSLARKVHGTNGVDYVHTMCVPNKVTIKKGTIEPPIAPVVCDLVASVLQAGKKLNTSRAVRDVWAALKEHNGERYRSVMTSAVIRGEPTTLGGKQSIVLHHNNRLNKSGSPIVYVPEYNGDVDTDLFGKRAIGDDEENQKFTFEPSFDFFVTCSFLDKRLPLVLAMDEARVSELFVQWIKQAHPSSCVNKKQVQDAQGRPIYVDSTPDKCVLPDDLVRAFTDAGIEVPTHFQWLLYAIRRSTLDARGLRVLDSAAATNVRRDADGLVINSHECFVFSRLVDTTDSNGVDPKTVVVDEPRYTLDEQRRRIYSGTDVYGDVLWPRLNADFITRYNVKPVDFSVLLEQQERALLLAATERQQLDGDDEHEQEHAAPAAVAAAVKRQRIDESDIAAASADAFQGFTFPHVPTPPPTDIAMNDAPSATVGI